MPLKTRFFCDIQITRLSKSENFRNRFYQFDSIYLRKRLRNNSILHTNKPMYNTYKNGSS
jgi:hypothetical protein